MGMKLNVHQWLGLIVAALLTGMFLSECEAANNDLWLDINMGSYHERGYWWTRDDNGTITEGEFNQKNFGLGLTYGINNYVDINGGFYDNSYNKNSFYAGAIIKYPLPIPSDYLRVEPGIKLNVATGYTGTPDDEDTWNGLMAAPMLHLGVQIVDTVGIAIGYVPDFDGNKPKYHDTSTAIWTFQITTKLASF